MCTQVQYLSTCTPLPPPCALQPAGGWRYTALLSRPTSSVSVLRACRLVVCEWTIDRPIRGLRALCQVSAGLPANLPTSPLFFSSPTSPSPSPTWDVCHLGSWFWQQVAQTEPETKSFDTLKVKNPQRDPRAPSSSGPLYPFSPIWPRPSSSRMPRSSQIIFYIHFYIIILDFLNASFCWTLFVYQEETRPTGTFPNMTAISNISQHARGYSSRALC